MSPSHNVVIMFFEPGLRKIVQAGKFVQSFCPGSGARWVYQYDIPMADRMACLDSWGVAPCILREMESDGIEEIHYYNQDADVTYIATVALVRERGILQAYRGRGVYYYHLPLAEWRKVGGRPCSYPYTRLVRILQWVEESQRIQKPQPVQMSLL